MFLYNSTIGSNGIGGAISLVGSGDVIGNTFYGNSQSYVFFGGSTIAYGFEGSNLRNNIIAASIGTEAILAFQVTLCGSCNVFWCTGQGCAVTSVGSDVSSRSWGVIKGNYR